jgi:acetyltransferase-like isoleucine patch superfamily enzyme
MITTLRPEAEIVIGSGVGMSGTVICAAQSVRIGERVMLGANTTVTDTDSHPIDYRERHAVYYGLDPQLADGATRIAPVIIEDDVFVGMHAIIMKGVTIGRGAVIAAGSVVVRDVPAGSVVAGIPARIIKSVHQDEPLRQQDSSEPRNSGFDADLS